MVYINKKPNAYQQDEDASNHTLKKGDNIILILLVDIIILMIYKHSHSKVNYTFYKPKSLSSFPSFRKILNIHCFQLSIKNLKCLKIKFNKEGKYSYRSYFLSFKITKTYQNFYMH